MNIPRYVFLVFLFIFLLTTAHAGVVKMTSSRICHPETSPYFSRIKNFKSYPSVHACLNAGGRLPKNIRSSNVTKSVKKLSASGDLLPNVSSVGKYKRSHFGYGWADIDHDGQDARQEALIAQSTSAVRFKSNSRRKVASGRWISPFTNNVIHDPSKIDIDHVVPLKWAWQNGANSWSQQKREQFANDPANLISVEASLNRQKGAKGPDLWLPPLNQCEYVLRFFRILKKYNISVPSSLKQVRLRVCNSNTMVK